MQKFKFVLSLLFPLSITVAEVSSTTEQSSANRHYAVMESFVGGLWLGTARPTRNGPQLSLELRFRWAGNKEGVCFDSAFVKDGKREPYTSGLYAWNAAKGKLAYFCTESDASLGEGIVTQEGEVLVHDITITNQDGTVENARLRLTKVNTDVFTDEIFLLKNGVWSKEVDVRYERHK